MADDSFFAESPFDADVFDPEPTPLTETAVADIATLLPYVEPSGNPRTMAVVRPGAPDQMTMDGAAPRHEVDYDQPVGLIYASKEGGTGHGHFVVVQANGQLTCNCWPALRQLPRGCHRMVAARKLLGMPEVE